MKKTLLTLGTAVALLGGNAWAQPAPDRADDRRAAPPLPPVLAVLDTDGDSVLSAEELAAASERLATLDANGDGMLTAEEVRPARRAGPLNRQGPAPRALRDGRGPGPRALRDDVVPARRGPRPAIADDAGSRPRDPAGQYRGWGRAPRRAMGPGAAPGWGPGYGYGRRGFACPCCAR